MRVIKFFLIFCFTFISFISSVDALICDNADIERLESLASYVEVSYEYVPESDGEESIVNAYLLDIVNLTDELYISINSYDHYYNEVKDGSLSLLVNSGNVSIDVYSTRCRDILLRNISLKLPKFNVYSYKTECEGLDIDICDEWYQGILNDDIFYSKIAEYNRDNAKDVSIFDQILEIFNKYYVYIIGAILVIILIVIATLIHRKRSVLEWKINLYYYLL